MKPDALLTTNTSSIPLVELRDAHPATGAVRGPALLQSGRADAAGGNRPPRRDGRRHAAAPGGVLQGDRQAAGAGRGHAGLPRQPRAVSVPAGSGHGIRRRHSRRRDRQGRDALRHADGADRTDRHGRPGRRGRRGARAGAVPRARRFRRRCRVTPEAGKRGKKDGQGLYTMGRRQAGQTGVAEGLQGACRPARIA